MSNESGMEYNKEQTISLKNLNEIVARLPEPSNAFAGRETGILDRRTPFGDYSFYRKFNSKTNEFYYEFIGHIIF